MDYKEKTIIDLSDATNISDLVLKINSELESDNTRDKNVYLNLGKIDLKQSQLLSIKALIETMDSKLAGVQTSSDMTEASAVGLGLPVGDFSPKTTPTFSETFKNTASQEEKIICPHCKKVIGTKIGKLFQVLDKRLVSLKGTECPKCKNILIK